MLDQLKSLDVLAHLPTWLIVCLCVFLSLVLFLPNTVADIVGIADFRHDYRGWIGVCWLLAVTLTVAKGLLWTKSVIGDRLARRSRELLLHELTPDEKGYLVPYISGEVSSLDLDVADGVAGGLAGKGIIRAASSIGSLIHGVPYNLQPWARRYLKEHPELLEGARGRPLTPRERRGLR
ncbi:MAG: super-infection exclusion protein B [Gemmataceae bacterium]